MDMKNHPNIVFTHYQISGMVGKAYSKSATAGIVANEFRKTGLFPCNLHIFDETDPEKNLSASSPLVRLKFL